DPRKHRGWSGARPPGNRASDHTGEIASAYFLAWLCRSREGLYAGDGALRTNRRRAPAFPSTCRVESTLPDQGRRATSARAHRPVARDGRATRPSRDGGDRPRAAGGFSLVAWPAGGGTSARRSQPRGSRSGRSVRLGRSARPGLSAFRVGISCVIVQPLVVGVSGPRAESGG